ncbi:Oxygen-independent coproporphyrinogen-III oxidase-like protein [Botrimarina colliarenosi]|uniref:Heme chaperone HemW n=1 Tax=Botrimarina colliarenosi TaxID=2528001 RepID=A0A5C6ALC5_9BACT|nr:radical SAM family heme chaperone HemW [Botrimarina colliarenosi]TWU00059.1 Oxygen-independent coproporphyrinogen-III oxidase-like protein [Botrimarina colliarenosi]
MTAIPPTVLPTSAYLHVPFCRHRCGYCNFAVVAGRDDLVPAYLRALATELAQLTTPRPIETLYLGGGTPTRLPTPRLDELLTLARRWFPPQAGVAPEFTVEANPGDLTVETVRLLARHGVTRLSLGVQSLNPAKLRQLERDHTPADVRQVVDAAHDAGIAPAIDLIFAAPGETLEAWRADLDEALTLRPSHVSTYGLTYEKGTSFWSRRLRGDLSELGDDLQRGMYELAIDRLAEAGLEHYEVSNFARPGRRSRHNESYWTGREWYAAGPGAARYVGGVRETNHRSTTTWIRRLENGEPPVAEREELSPEERARERLVFGLRRLEGVRYDAFAAQTHHEVAELAGEAIARFVSLGLLVDDGQVVRLTRNGLMVSDAIWPDLL